MRGVRVPSVFAETCACARCRLDFADTLSDAADRNPHRPRTDVRAERIHRVRSGGGEGAAVGWPVRGVRVRRRARGRRARDVLESGALRKSPAGTPGYLGVGELQDDATVSDLTPLSLDADDVTALKKCREGSCEVQLPQASIQAVRDTVNFSRPDAAEQVNALARQMIVALLRRYRQGGLRALGEYRDKEHPARVSDEFETMTRASVLPDLIPTRRHLLSIHTHRSRMPVAILLGRWTSASNQRSAESRHDRSGPHHPRL